MPARQSRWQAQHVGCQKAVDNVHADLTKEIERLNGLLQKRISFVCSDCGDDFTETLEAFVLQGMDEIQAPALCVRCGHGAEMEE